MKKAFKYLLCSSLVASIGALSIVNAYALVNKIDCDALANPKIFNNNFTYDPLKTPKGTTFIDSMGIKWIVSNSVPKGAVSNGVSDLSMVGYTTTMRCSYFIGGNYLDVDSVNVNVSLMSNCSFGMCTSVSYTMK